MGRADRPPRSGDGRAASDTTKRGAERGQATLELALCLPLVAAVLATLVEIGMLASDQLRLWHAAREAARTAAVDPEPAAARTAAEHSGLTPLEMSISPPLAYRRQGDPVTVSLVYGPRSGVPLIGAVIDRLTLRAAATMRIEQP
jgi:hypothetical protein